MTRIMIIVRRDSLRTAGMLGSIQRTSVQHVWCVVSRRANAQTLSGLRSQSAPNANLSPAPRSSHWSSKGTMRHPVIRQIEKDSQTIICMPTYRTSGARCHLLSQSSTNHKLPRFGSAANHKTRQATRRKPLSIREAEREESQNCGRTRQKIAKHQKDGFQPLGPCLSPLTLVGAILPLLPCKNLERSRYAASAASCLLFGASPLSDMKVICASSGTEGGSGPSDGRKVPPAKPGPPKACRCTVLNGLRTCVDWSVR